MVNDGTLHTRISSIQVRGYEREEKRVKADKKSEQEIQEAENKSAAARKVLAHIGERVRGRKKANGEGREAKESQQMSEIVREITDMRVLTVHSMYYHCACT